MIKPDRHTNPDYSVINISAYILRQLKAQYIIGYDQLLEKVVKGMGEKSRENYPYALNFLYLLGKLQYKEANDTFIYNEAQ
ncbi:hypothetical protein SAMN04488511_102303 [Pedobacter suwonensis]|uniref:Uncharacterized protein n=1 Tax=Pedobacter suwonensis TaxID=332999 RepID=A0A1I0SPA9_9SPHI|nr:ABC-three component system middle component 8 [Pedobacter suwonensis]SFA41341.1 hypothetical protein SAMN04488511_102303 [Pedobacter suwonensis]